MADIKVTGLPAAPDVQLPDLVHLIDTSSGLSTKATVEQLQAAILQNLSAAVCTQLRDELIGCFDPASLIALLNTNPGTFDGQSIIWDQANNTWVLSQVVAQSFDITQQDGDQILSENGDVFVQEIAP